VIAVPAKPDLDAAAMALGERLGLTIGLVEIAGAGRAADHAAGRTAAQKAFERAGAQGLGVLGNAPDGRPQWPPGWAGSISHGAGYAVAAISRDHDAVGIDVERSGALLLADAELVLSAHELAQAAAGDDPAIVATAIWSAKEAAFKAWSGAGGGLHNVDPVDIHIDADSHRGTVRARTGGRLVGDAEVHEPLEGAFGTVGEVLLMVVVGGGDEKIALRGEAE
jgi:4'-phosphopantetheinyl transferase EntD